MTCRARVPACDTIYLLAFSDMSHHPQYSLSDAPCAALTMAEYLLQTAAENAEVLAALAGGHDASSELFLYFTKLHIQARGACTYSAQMQSASRQH